MPTPSLTDIEVAQRACTIAGIEKIDSFNQPGNTAAQVLNDTYEDIVQDCLTIRPWRFATWTQALGPPLSLAPPVQFRAAYNLPAAPPALQLRTVYLNGALVTFYKVYGQQLWIDAGINDAIEVEALWRLGEEVWPPWFRLYAISRLGAFLSASVTRNGELAKFLADEAEKQLARAGTRDSQQQTTTKLRYTKIRSARLGGRPI